MNREKVGLSATDFHKDYGYDRSLEHNTLVAVINANASGEAVSMNVGQLRLGEAGGWSTGFTSRDDAPPVLAIGAHSFVVLRRK